MQELHELKLLARAGIPSDLIALELQRTEESVRAIARRKRIVLRPIRLPGSGTNESAPFGLTGKLLV